MNDTMTISQLANTTGISVHVLRNYLVEGLIDPNARTPGGYRLFGESTEKTLCLIQSARVAGLTTKDLKPLIMALKQNNHNKARESVKTLQLEIKQKQQDLYQFTKDLEALSL